MAELQEVAVGIVVEMLDEAPGGGAVVGVRKVLAGGFAGAVEGDGAEGGEFARVVGGYARGGNPPSFLCNRGLTRRFRRAMRIARMFSTSSGWTHFPLLTCQ